MKAAVTVALLLALAGCSGYWGQRRLDQPTPILPHNPVWIWSDGTVQKWHGVVLTQDSVSGIPYDIPLECEHEVHWARGVAPCRRAIARNQVDSMRLEYHTAVEKVTKGVGAVVGILTVATLADGVLCYLLDRGDPQC